MLLDNTRPHVSDIVCLTVDELKIMTEYSRTSNYILGSLLKKNSSDANSLVEHV